jgi:hypothetical protein
VGATLGFASSASAAPLNLTVDNLGDPAGAGACADGTPGDCSLRQAVANANANAGETDFIEFQASLTGTLTLSAAAGGPITIVDPVYIYGNGPDETTVQAAAAPWPASQAFHVDLTTANQDVGIYSMTITGAEGTAIWNWDSDLHVANSLLTGNTGNVVYDRGYGGDSTFVHSTFAGNNGRAITGPFEAIVASTITDNTASRAPAVFVNQYPGGAIYDSTISGNHADDGGSATGAVEMSYAILINTVVANTSGPNVRDVDGFAAYAVSSLIESDFINELEGSGNILGLDPQLGDLAMNGGDTPTFMPAASSPVVDAGFSTAHFDQRGSARIVDNPNAPNAPGGNGADIGAVELPFAGGPQAPSPSTTSGTTFNLKKAIRRCKRRFQKGPKRQRCIRRARRRAGLLVSPARRSVKPADNPFVLSPP